MKMKIGFLSFTIFLAILTSCNYIDKYIDNEDVVTENDSNNINGQSMLKEFESQFTKNEKDSVKQPDTIVRYIPDPKYNSIARLISGIPVKDDFPTIQTKELYKVHSRICDKEWKDTKNENLYPVDIWIDENNITNRNDSLTLLYPFSGPDFLYANAFFPYTKNYILIGLEQSGSLPELDQLEDTTLNNYLTGIRYSLRYINKVGYFTTNQMRSDFSDSTLDGVVHILLFYITRTGNQVVDVSDIYINNTGTEIAASNSQKKSNWLKALKIQFTDNIAPYLKTLYYFRLNLENTNLEKHPGFSSFIVNSGKLITYIKSGSYILHNGKFSTFRNLILNRSMKILQDDTGIPYYLLNTPGFDLKLYGKYTRTIDEFEYNYQPKLKEALEAQSENKYLPFKLGYNAWHDETVLLYACSKSYGSRKPVNIVKKEINQPLVSKGLVYRVQILTSSRLINKKHYKFAGLPNVSYYTVDGTYKYTIGNETSIESCKELQKLAKQKGFKDAFVIALHDNTRITLEEARKLSN